MIQGVEVIALITHEPALANTISIMIYAAVVLVSMKLVTDACLRIDVFLVCTTSAMIDFNSYLEQRGMFL